MGASHLDAGRFDPHAVKAQNRPSSLAPRLTKSRL